jgi:hypothetical protein
MVCWNAVIWLHPRPRGGDLLAGRQGLIEAGREERLELAVEIGDLELDALGLSHQLVDLGDGLADRRKLGKGDGGEVLGLIDQALRLILQHGDLVVDLLQRAGGGQDVLAVIRGIEDRAHELSVRRAGDQHGGGGEGQRGARRL